MVEEAEALEGPSVMVEERVIMVRNPLTRFSI